MTSQWYIVHTYSNFEKKAAEEIKRQAQIQGLNDLIEDVMVPTEEVVEVRREPKYVPHNRWHIERWVPAESYGSPEQWRAETIEIQNGRNIPALGPYPSRGEYEHCFTLEGPRGEFVQLTPAVARQVARAIEASRGMPRAKRREALEDRTRREEREYEAYADEVLQ